MGEAGGETGRRIAAWRRTGDLSALWPDLPAAARAAAHREIRAATAAVLAGDGRPRLAAPDERGTRALGAAAFLTGMGPLLGHWIERGRVEAAGPARELFAEHLEHGRRRMARLAEAAERVVRGMEAGGVHPILLKGLHTGAVYFPEPGTRPGADIDLLVRPDEEPEAAAALARAGFVEARRTRWAARSEWVPAGADQRVRSLSLDHADDPFSVDLHVRLERWYFRGVRAGLGDGPFQGMARLSPEKSPGHRPVRVLEHPYLAAFLALHAGYEPGGLRLVRLVELALVLRGDEASGTLVWSDLADLLERTGTGRFAHPGLALTESLAPGTVEPGLLADLERGATRRTARVLDALRAGDLAPLPRPSLDAKLMWARSPRELLLNLSELVLPSDDGVAPGLARLQWRRIEALATGRAGWRAGGGADRLRP